MSRKIDRELIKRIKTVSLDYKILDSINDNFGEAFYLLDSSKFARNFDEFLSLFSKIYPNTNVGYSYKTNYTPKLCKIVNDKGGYAEVVSEMEYDLAIKLGIDPKMIIINGPYKPKKALEKFLLGGSVVNLDSHAEVESLKTIALSHSHKKFSVGLRCNFDINDSSISRFGFDVESEIFLSTFFEVSNISNVTIDGIHCHFPNRDLESYLHRVENILYLAKKLFPKPPKYIDIGGGFFGKMADSLKAQFSQPTVEYKSYADLIATKFEEAYCDYPNDEKPLLLLEPGSAIVADTMCFVAKVISLKEVRGRTIATSSGSKFNIGLLTSNINMPMKVYNRSENKNKHREVDVVSYTCIEGDCLYKGYSGNIGMGDYLVFSNVGSYSIVFKPQFIMPNVPIIEYNESLDSYEVVRRQETMEDIFSTFVF
tara:strand:- start:2223 stop:3500 length:1278 start_codon:yes stop_codon:yes gene_type:complete